MFHVTQRLFLRPHFPEDWEAVYRGICDEGIVRNLARAPWPYMPEHAQDFAKLPQDPFEPRFAITLRGEPGAPLVGCIGLDRKEGKDPQAIEVGYWLARDHWGRGLTTEALLAVCDVAKMLGYTNIAAEHFVDNPASGKVMMKAGFAPTGKQGMGHSLGRAEPSAVLHYERALVGKLRGEEGPETLRKAA